MYKFIPQQFRVVLKWLFVSSHGINMIHGCCDVVEDNRVYIYTTGSLVWLLLSSHGINMIHVCCDVVQGNRIN